jgi:oxygen-dependent protoporphyrinogen oxidase
VLTHDAIVVGAGAAGLAAAVELRRAGRSVEVLEASERIGGLAQTERRDGFLIERGPASLSQPSPEVTALLELVGLWPRRITPLASAVNRWTVRRGRLVPVPRSPFQLLRSPLLSPRGKLRLAGAFVSHAAEPGKEESLGAFVSRRLGREALERLADPFQQGIFAGDPARLSMTHAFPGLREMETEHGSLMRAAVRGRRTGRTMVSFPGGIAELTAMLAAQLPGGVRTGAAVHAVRPHRDGWDVQLEDGSHLVSRELLLAIPPRQLGMLVVDERLGPALEYLTAMPAASLATVALGYPRSRVAHPLDGVGVLIPHCERRQVLGILFSSSSFAERAPADQVLLTVLIGGIRQDALVHQPDEALTEIATHEAATLLGALGPPTLSMVSRWPAAIPQLDLGHGRRIEAAAAIEQRNRGLALAGSWRCGVGLAAALESGLRAARRLEGLAAA